MIHSLNSAYLQFAVNRDTATWSLHGSQQDSPFIENAWMQVDYRCNNTRFVALLSWDGAEIHTSQQDRSRHGILQQLKLILGPDNNGLQFIIEFAIPETYPLLLWRLIIDNQGNNKVEIERILMFQAGFMPDLKRLPSFQIRANPNKKRKYKSGSIRPHPNPGELGFFSNGWQSWSFTGALGEKETYKDTHLGLLTSSMWFNPGTPRPYKPGHFASDMYGVLGDRKHRTGILAGFLSQKQHFGSLEANVNQLYPAMALWANGDQVTLDFGNQMQTDWAAIQFVSIDSPDPLGPYLDAVRREHDINSPSHHHTPSIGWCSWYQYYQDISENKIRENLHSAVTSSDTLPRDLFQIDDGFQAQIGDWLDFSPTFPNGVAPLAREISSAGLSPGLWLAPFIVHSKSKLKHIHTEWLLHNRFGKPINAGFVWNNFNKALDLTHPDALGYVKEVVNTAVHDWGYQFLKLDFLYAAAIKGYYHDQTKTRAQVLRMGLEALRDAAGQEVHLLGCGVPLGPAIGIFDSMRIGADVDPSWQPSFSGIKFPFRNEYPMPSTRNAIHNVLTRSHLNQRWWINDPDCLLVRPDSDLSLGEVQSLATVIAFSGGHLLLSDDLTSLPAERLRIAEQLVPLIGQRPRVIDWFDKPFPCLVRLDLENSTGVWHLLAVFNWADQTRDLRVSLKDFAQKPEIFFAREFWSGNFIRISEGRIRLENVPSHGVRLLALRPEQRGEPCYLGGDLHISQGLEVDHWSGTSKFMNLQLVRYGKTEGQIDLYLPHKPTQITVNQEKTDWQVLGEDIYRVKLGFNQNAKMLITFQ